MTADQTMALATGVMLALAAALLAVAAICALVRIVLGPSLPDRVVALDAIALLAICAIGLAALATRAAAMLDAAMAMALVSFVGTVALARYAERRHARGAPPPPTGRPRRP